MDKFSSPNGVVLVQEEPPTDERDGTLNFVILHLFRHCKMPPDQRCIAIEKL